MISDSSLVLLIPSLGKYGDLRQEEEEEVSIVQLSLSLS